MSPSSGRSSITVRASCFENEVVKLTEQFLDSSQVDFRNPESFFHDVNSVAGLLKQFFRDLPDPLLTHEHFQALIEAARKFSAVEICSPFTDAEFSDA